MDYYYSLLALTLDCSWTSGGVFWSKINLEKRKIKDIYGLILVLMIFEGKRESLRRGA